MAGDVQRRVVLATGLAVGGQAIAGQAVAGLVVQNVEKSQGMYGLIGQMLAAPGKRDDLIAILTGSAEAMPGCLSYVIAQDPANADAVWITEVWTDKASHAASLNLPSVQAAIAKARPIIAGFGHRFETAPVAGVGLAAG